MGRPRATLELIENIRRDAAFVRDNESAAILQLKVLLLGGNLERLLGCAPITHHTFEYHLKGVGFIDLLLSHADGGVTIIEAKGPGTSRELSHGIGQLFLYEAAFRRLHDAQKPLAYVDRVLCAPADVGSEPTLDACKLAGVSFLRLTTFRHLHKVWDREMQG